MYKISIQILELQILSSESGMESIEVIIRQEKSALFRKTASRMRLQAAHIHPFPFALGRIYRTNTRVFIYPPHSLFISCICMYVYFCRRRFLANNPDNDTSSHRGRQSSRGGNLHSRNHRRKQSRATMCACNYRDYVVSLGISWQASFLWRRCTKILRNNDNAIGFFSSM